MKEHDYTKRYWGHDFVIHTVLKDGEELKMTGWGDGIKQGEFLLLPNGPDSTRYRVDSVEYWDDPSDMWKITARFAPRNNLVPNP